MAGMADRLAQLVYGGQMTPTDVSFSGSAMPPAAAPVRPAGVPTVQPAVSASPVRRRGRGMGAALERDVLGELPMGQRVAAGFSGSGKSTVGRSAGGAFVQGLTSSMKNIQKAEEKRETQRAKQDKADLDRAEKMLNQAYRARREERAEESFNALQAYRKTQNERAEKRLAFDEVKEQRIQERHEQDQARRADKHLWARNREDRAVRKEDRAIEKHRIALDKAKNDAERADARLKLDQARERRAVAAEKRHAQTAQLRGMLDKLKIRDRISGKLPTPQQVQIGKLLTDQLELIQNDVNLIGNDAEIARQKKLLRRAFEAQFGKDNIPPMPQATAPGTQEAGTPTPAPTPGQTQAGEGEVAQPKTREEVEKLAPGTPFMWNGQRMVRQ